MCTAEILQNRKEAVEFQNSDLAVTLTLFVVKVPARNSKIQSVPLQVMMITEEKLTQTHRETTQK